MILKYTEWERKRGKRIIELYTVNHRHVLQTPDPVHNSNMRTCVYQHKVSSLGYTKNWVQKDNKNTLWNGESTYKMGGNEETQGKKRRDEKRNIMKKRAKVQCNGKWNGFGTMQC